MCLLCLLHWQADSLPLSHLGSPEHLLSTVNTVEMNEGSFPSFCLPKVPPILLGICLLSRNHVFAPRWSAICILGVALTLIWGGERTVSIYEPTNVDSTSEGSKISASAAVSTT